MIVGSRACGRSPPAVRPLHVPPITAASAAPRPRRGASIPGLTLAAQPMVAFAGRCARPPAARGRRRERRGLAAAAGRPGKLQDCELERVNAHPTVVSALRALGVPGAAPQVRERDARAPRGGSRSPNRGRAPPPPPPREHARPLTDSRRGRGADPGTGCRAASGVVGRARAAAPASWTAWRTSAH